MSSRLAENLQQMTSCRLCLAVVLRMCGLRPTRQRLALAELLLVGPHRHVSAEQLHGEAREAHLDISLATVYNTLHQFQEVGLLRQVAFEASKTYFDTDTSNHHHFYLEDEQRVIDVPPSTIVLQSLPPPPAGTMVTHVDVLVRVKKTFRP
jgi:Fur family iron response transcriptional regulator